MRSLLWFFAFAILLVSCKVSTVSSTSNKKEIRLWATYYYVPTLAHDEDGMPLLDRRSKSGLCDCKRAIGAMRPFKV
ncbi:MAG: hypothetical protein RIF46_13675, partial [Cyclobacteriaceae bacterium]